MRDIEESFGPVYPDLGSSVAKFRRAKNPDKHQRLAHGEAVHKAIQAKQRTELQRELPSIAPSCASRTWHACGEEIHKAVRRQQESALQACAGKERRARTPAQWQSMYDEAMRKKRRVK